jgi:hypothetical protein
MKAGIYAVVALAHDCPTCAITRDVAPDCYPAALKVQGQKVINEFARYPNTLAFSAGNEVNHFAPVGIPQWNAPCQKKFIQDMRGYMQSCPTIRHVPVGLVSADDQRKDLAQYYNCPEEFKCEEKVGCLAGTENDGAAEWYGLNSYLFCDGHAQTLEIAPGMQMLQEAFASFNYSIPVVLTEFGCLSDTFPTIDGFEGQRTFDQARWLLEDDGMRALFAGGFAFEYSIEYENAFSDSPFPFNKFGKQNYGIGYLDPKLCDDVNIDCSYIPLPAYYALQRAYLDSNITQTTTRIKYSVPDNRAHRSLCPQQFAPLSSFIWGTDDVENLQCPPPGPTSSFVCNSSKRDPTLSRPEETSRIKHPPKMQNEQDTGNSGNKDATSKQESAFFTASLAFGGALLVGCFLFLSKRVWNFYMSSMESDDVTPFTIVIPNNIHRGQHDGGNCDSSSESSGLLSMQGYRRRQYDGAKSSAVYQSLR